MAKYRADNLSELDMQNLFLKEYRSVVGNQKDRKVDRTPSSTRQVGREGDGTKDLGKSLSKSRMGTLVVRDLGLYAARRTRRCR